jgi:hypothetical protein
MNCARHFTLLLVAGACVTGCAPAEEPFLGSWHHGCFGCGYDIAFKVEGEFKITGYSVRSASEASALRRCIERWTMEAARWTLSTSEVNVDYTNGQWSVVRDYCSEPDSNQLNPMRVERAPEEILDQVLPPGTYGYRFDAESILVLIALDGESIRFDRHGHTNALADGRL